jgi:hypothetical protein
MAVAFVQGKFAFTDASSRSTQAVVFTSNVMAGNLIAVFVKYGTATSVFSSITDSLGNTYTAVSSTDYTAAGNTIKTFYARNIAGGACTVTLNFTAANGVYPRIMVHEYSGLDTTASVLNASAIANQDAAGAVATTDLLVSGSATTTVNGCKIVGFCIDHSRGTISVNPGTGFTARTAGTTPANNFDQVYSASLVQSTAGAIQAKFSNVNTCNNPERFSIAMMAFAPPGAAVVKLPRRLRVFSQAIRRANM